MTTDTPVITEETCRAILRGIALRERVSRLTNYELSQALFDQYIRTPLNSLESEVLDEAISRLRVIDVPVDEIRRRIEAELNGDVELSDEEVAAMDLAFEGVMRGLKDGDE